MKQRKLLITLIAALLALTLGMSLAACDEDTPCTEHVDANADGKCDNCDTTVEPDDSGTVDPNQNLVLVENSKTKFSVLCATSLSDKSEGYINDFVQMLNRYYLEDSALKQNYDAPGFDDELEIIFGSPANRGEAFIKDDKYLGFKGFSIEVIGNKIFVLGGGDKGYQNALDYIEKTLFDLNKYGDKTIDTLAVPKDTKYEDISSNYAVTEFTIDGKSVSEFVIAYENTAISAKEAALKLQDTIYKQSGIWVKNTALSKVKAEDNVIYVESTKGDPDRRTDNGFIIYVKDGDLHIECEFDNKFDEVMSDFMDSKLSSGKAKLSSTYTFTKDIRNIYYKDFGAVGDGVTDDFFAIKNCHSYANQFGHIVNADGPDKTYYIGNYLAEGDSTSSIIVQTDTNFHGCTFIWDDSVVPAGSPCYNSPIFHIKTSGTSKKYSGQYVPVASLSKGTESLGDWTPGVECLIFIENSNERHYIRYGLNSNNGSSQHEIILVHADGTIDPSTPLQWDYETITSLVVYPCNDTPITVTGGDGDQRVNVKTIANGAPSRYTYYNRNFYITRSNVTLQNINHLMEGEIPESEGGTGAPYTGFTKVQYANNVTIQNMLIHNLVGYHLETNKSNGMGSYEMSAAYSNNVLWKNVIQDVFFDADGGVSYEGLMGTNYCKNLVFDSNFICSFDAHCGVYNGTIKNSTIEHLNFIGDGLITIENTTLYLDGSKTAIQLRSDYGATWRGDVYMKDVNLKYEMKTKNSHNFSLVSSSWTNHDFGYTCYLPQNIYIENVNMLGFSVTVKNGVRDEKIVETNAKELYLFTAGTVYKYTDIDISDPNADVSMKPNDWAKCTCGSFNDTDGDGRCNTVVVGPSQQKVWCWGFEQTPDKTVNINPYIGTKSVTVVNGDTSNPLTVVWPLTPQFKDMDVTVDGVLIIENGVKL